MRRRVVGIVLVGGGLGLVAWLVASFLKSAPDPESTRSSVTAGEPAAIEVAEGVADAEVVADPGAEGGVSRVEETFPGVLGAPESYRRALSGLSGRLVEEDATPVSGLSVELLQVNISSFAQAGRQFLDEARVTDADLILDRAVSDEEGRFVLDGAVVRGFQALGIDLGGARSTVRVVDRTLGSGVTTDLGDIVLAPFVTFTGTVVDARGRAMAGARVRATALPRLVLVDGVQNVRAESLGLLTDFFGGDQLVLDFPPELLAIERKLPIPTTYTEEDGSFRLAGVPIGLSSVIIDQRGTAGLIHGPVPTGRRPERDVGTLTVPDGRRMAGIVVGQEGQPIAGAEVAGGAIIVPGAFALLARSGTSDANGAFSVGGIHGSGELYAMARATPDAAWEIVGPIEEAGAVEIRLQPPGTWPLSTVDEHGELLPGVQVGLRPETVVGELPIPALAPYRSRPGRVVEVEPGRHEVRGLPRGSYQFVARLEGRATALVEKELEPEMEPVVLALLPARSLRVTVLDAARSEPVEHALVGLGPRSKSGLLSYDRAPTDPEGVASLGSLPIEAVDGEIDLRVDHPGYAVAVHRFSIEDWNSLDEEFTVRLQGGGAIEGLVTVLGEVPDRPLFFMFEESGISNHPDDEIPRFALTDLEGRFRVDLLMPGTYRWEVVERFLEGDPASLDFEKIDGMRSLKRGQVEVREGEVASIEVEIDPRQNEESCGVRGRYLAADGAAHRLTVILEGQTDRQREVTTGEWFEFEELRAGRYELIATQDAGNRGRSHALHVEQFELTPRQFHDFDATLEFLDVVVHVVDGVGAPVVGMACSAQKVAKDDDDWSFFRYSQGTTTDFEGRARMVLPIRGSWRFFVNDPRVGVGSVTAEVEGATELRLELDPGVLCQGRLIPPPGVSISPESFVLLNPVDDDAHRQVFSVADGLDFDVRGMSPGSYEVGVVDRRSRQNLVGELHLPAGGASGLVVRLKVEE